MMESGGPALCSIHAAEDEPGLAADEAGFTEPGRSPPPASRRDRRRYRPRSSAAAARGSAAAHAIAAACERLDTPSCR